MIKFNLFSVFNRFELQCAFECFSWTNVATGRKLEYISFEKGTDLLIPLICILRPNSKRFVSISMGGEESSIQQLHVCSAI